MVLKAWLLVLTISFASGYSIDSQASWSPKPSEASFPEQRSSVEHLPVEGGATPTWATTCSDGDEDAGNASVACHGTKILKRVVDQWLETPRSFRIYDGLDLVKVGEESVSTSRNLVDEDVGVLGRLSRFISSHELRIQLKDFLPSRDAMAKMLKNVGTDDVSVTGRRKDKGGGGGALMAMGLMMKAMMGALGLGGVGLLAMKALMVSGMAFMLAAIVGIKGLTSKDDGGGTHHVNVVPVHHGGEHGHYKRKRSIDDTVEPYRGYFAHK